MWLDVNLDWHYHIDVMRSNISRRIGVLKRVRSYLTGDLTIKLHDAMVLPLFDYCDTIYGTTDYLALSKLQQLQNRGAKNHTQSTKRYTYSNSAKRSQMATSY